MLFADKNFEKNTNGFFFFFFFLLIQSMPIPFAT